MTQTTITIHTDPTLKQKAEAHFGEFGIDLEEAINLYLSKIVKEDDDNVKLFEVADEDLSSEHLAQIKRVDQLSKDEFFIQSEQECIL